jgi:hypothetical protein
MSPAGEHNKIKISPPVLKILEGGTVKELALDQLLS